MESKAFRIYLLPSFSDTEAIMSAIRSIFSGLATEPPIKRGPSLWATSNEVSWYLKKVAFVKDAVNKH